ncbi:MAG TPA: SPOR domain-containing protein [Gemmatimonadaceae bacterium]|nr:SPOR domain-containing protein [Gemmatimonadaceae bacterium]
MHRFLGVLCLSLVPFGILAAQSDGTTTDTTFLAAQRLVVEGRGQEGRAIIARELAAAPEGSPRYIEALYWRAALAATAADAERDYKRIIIEFPVSRRAESALVGLAQLELARGDRSQAMQHLERVVREHPTGPSRARASFWMARVHFDEGNFPRACARLEDSRRHTPADAVEMRNQLAYYSQRCEGVDTTVVVRATSAESTRAMPSRPGAVATPPGQRPAAGASARGATAYTVQIGAFANRGDADARHRQLSAQGHAPRVVKVGALWRVRIGRYPSRDAATVAARSLKAKKIDAFVTEAESP